MSDVITWRVHQGDRPHEIEYCVRLDCLKPHYHYQPFHPLVVKR